MKINGLQLSFLDIPSEYVQEYNRWYDLDHMPEHVSKPDVLMGRRYVAPRHLRGLPGTQEAEVFGGHAPYLTIYSFGGPLDMMSEEAREGWKTMDRAIIKAGRYWAKGRVTGSGHFRLAEATARPEVLVSPPAIPYLHHRGVIVAYGEAPSADRRDEAIAWWRDTHLHDLFTAPGVLAALRGDPVDEADGRILHLLLCEAPPLEVMEQISGALRYAGALGRYPAHREAYRSIAFLPYDSVVPLQYDFDMPELSLD